MADTSPVGLPGIKTAAALLARQSFVIGQVVGLAHERVNCADGVSPRFGQSHEGVVEILGLAPGDCAAESVGFIQFGIVRQSVNPHILLPRRKKGKSLPLTARRSRANFVVFEMAGRLLSTSYP